MLKWLRKYIPPLREIDELNKMWDEELDRVEELSARIFRDADRIASLQHENFNLGKINDIKDRDISCYRDEVHGLKERIESGRKELVRQTDEAMTEFRRSEEARYIVRSLIALYKGCLGHQVNNEDAVLGKARAFIHPANYTNKQD